MDEEEFLQGSSEQMLTGPHPAERSVGAIDSKGCPSSRSWNRMKQGLGPCCIPSSLFTKAPLPQSHSSTLLYRQIQGKEKTQLVIRQT